VSTLLVVGRRVREKRGQKKKIEKIKQSKYSRQCTKRQWFKPHVASPKWNIFHRGVITLDHGSPSLVVVCCGGVDTLVHHEKNIKSQKKNSRRIKFDQHLQIF